MRTCGTWTWPKTVQLTASILWEAVGEVRDTAYFEACT